MEFAQGLSLARYPERPLSILGKPIPERLFRECHDTSPIRSIVVFPGLSVSGIVFVFVFISHLYVTQQSVYHPSIKIMRYMKYLLCIE